MNTEELVKAFYAEKQSFFFAEYVSENAKTVVGQLIISLNLTDENGNQLSGELESYAYEYFHEKN